SRNACSSSSATRLRRPVAFHSAEGRKADVLVQDFDLSESDLSQKVQLEYERAGSVLLLDVGEHAVPVGFVLEPGQILAVLPPHELLDSGDRTLDQIEHPHRAAEAQRPVERCEDIPPFRVSPQMLHHTTAPPHS